MLTLKTVPPAILVRAPARAVPRVERAPAGHSRAEIAALLATLFLTVPVGLLMFLGL